MKVSCIIPVYNTSKYLKKCIKSVLKQTYKNFEIILVNDCSTDNSADICKEFANKYPDKIIFIDKPQNEGVDRARFTALEYVFKSNPEGAVTFVDSDDYIRRDSFKKMASEMTISKSDIAMMRFYRFYGPIRKKSYSPLPKQVITQPELHDRYYMSFFGQTLIEGYMCGKLYRVETIMKANLKPSGFKTCEDVMFNLRLFPYLKTYSIIEYRGYCYRFGGLTSRYNPYFWENLTTIYIEKRKFLFEIGYLKGLRLLNIELKNILLTSIMQRIQYLKESNVDLKNWIEKQLDRDELWGDITNLVTEGESNKELEYIARKDIDALLESARAKLDNHKRRNMIIKIIDKFMI